MFVLESSEKPDSFLREAMLGNRPTEISPNSRPLRSVSKQIYDFIATASESYRGKSVSYWILLVLSVGGMLIAFPASSLLSRIYFANGGKSKWIISWISVVGWPLPAFALIPTYFFCKTFPTHLTWQLGLSYVVLGFLSAADNLMYAYAYAYLPASTASLLASSSLIFSALFGYLLVGNKLNASIMNSIVVITVALTVIALDSDSDLYGNVSKSQYVMGFVWDILGSALHGLIFALSELVFVKFLGKVSFHVVLEQQIMVSFLGFIFTTIGCIIDGSFQDMASEARNFKGGKSDYYMVLIWGAITFQLGVLGATGILFLASTMLAGVLNAVRVPLTSIAAIILLHDPVSGFKILALIVTFWGFCSYIYGSSSVESSTEQRINSIHGSSSVESRTEQRINSIRSVD